MSLELPNKRDEIQRVVWDTLQVVKKRLGVTNRNAFSSLATEITKELWAKKQAQKKAHKGS